MPNLFKAKDKNSDRTILMQKVVAPSRGLLFFSSEEGHRLSNIFLSKEQSEELYKAIGKVLGKTEPKPQRNRGVWVGRQIFKALDCDADELIVNAAGGDLLIKTNIESPTAEGVLLKQESAEELRDALALWLAGRGVSDPEAETELPSTYFEIGGTVFDADAIESVSRRQGAEKGVQVSLASGASGQLPNISYEDFKKAWIKALS